MGHFCQATVVICGAIFVHLTLGTLYTFGNLSPYMTSYLRKHASPDLDYGTSVWINALAAMGQGVTMFFGGLLQRRLGPRLTVLLGAWFQSLGIILTYFTIQHSFALTMVTYGVMFGFGIGVAYAVPMDVGMKWLPQRKGLVNGCVVAGFGGGAFIFDQIQTAYINPNNLSPDLTVDDNKYFTQDEILDRVPKMFLILGGVYAGMQFLGCLLLRYPPEQDEYVTINDEDKDTSITPKQLFTQREFYILFVIFLLNGQGVNFVSSLYKAYGQTFIDDDVFLAAVGTFAAVCNAAGRIMWGTIADKFSFKTAMLYLCTLFTCLMLTLGVTGIAGRWMFIFWIGALFLGFSGSFSLMPTACARTFGSTSYTMNYGILFSSQVITSAISAALTSTLQVAIGWYGMFFLVAACSFCSLILTMCFHGKRADGRNV